MSASSTAQRPPRHAPARRPSPDILARTDEFRSAQQIHAALEAEGTKVGLATVYRNLQNAGGIRCGGPGAQRRG